MKMDKNNIDICHKNYQKLICLYAKIILFVKHQCFVLISNLSNIVILP